MTKKRKTVIIAAGCLICACIVALVFAIVERQREKQAMEEEYDGEDEEYVEVIPKLKDGNYYLDGDSALSPYYIELKADEGESNSGKAYLHGDLGQFIADWNLKYVPDETEEESSREINAPQRGEPETEKADELTYSELKEKLGEELDYWVAVIYENDEMKEEKMECYFHIGTIPPEGSIIHETDVTWDYISETEFSRNGKTFKLAG
ncbi:MAG: hypothetical protein IJ740_14925 [Ruminococcus sp.]|nr:hypothetical protein [Ruminococcus sp.]